VVAAVCTAFVACWRVGIIKRDVTIAFEYITYFRHGVIGRCPRFGCIGGRTKQNIPCQATVGGGIRSYTDPDSADLVWPRSGVAYFERADKISLGIWSAAEVLIASGVAR
jgi:hypothetical protein